MVNNHENQKCKECLQNLPTVVELLKHLAEHHAQHECDNSEEIELGDINEKDVKKEKIVKEKDVVKKQSICVWKGVHDRRERPLTGS